MYASTRKQPPFGTIVFIGILVLGLAIGGYFLYSYWKSKQASSLEISLNTPSEPESLSLAPSDSPDVISPIIETDEVKETLQKENDALITTIEVLESNQIKSDQLKLGRAVLSDFANRFFKYETVLNNQSFFQFFNTLVLNYIENRAISVKAMKTSDPLFPET